MEPPFRVLVRFLMTPLKLSARTRALWEVSVRPAYLLGVLTAAYQARRQGVAEICAIEFGVAGGRGLLALQDEAEAVERETGVRVKVFGFDAGAGLPSFIGDYRDHPDLWKPGDYAMDEPLLRSKLKDRTTLIIGNVADTVPKFFADHQPPPIGFVSFDLDLYSSTRDALRILSHPDRKMLWHVPVYFDDIGFLANHKQAGELLAIDEFNQQHDHVLIDHWYGIKAGRPFPERPFLDKMRVAHDLHAISNVMLDRPQARLVLSK
jgi:hypothetical protein